MCEKLKKAGLKNTSKNFRYFVLLRNYLLIYFESEQAYTNKEKPKGAIDLVFVTHVENHTGIPAHSLSNKKKKKSKPNLLIFTIETPARTWEILCSTLYQKEKWMNILRNYITMNRVNNNSIIDNNEYNIEREFNKIRSIDTLNKNEFKSYHAYCAEYKQQSLMLIENLAFTINSLQPLQSEDIFDDVQCVKSITCNHILRIIFVLKYYQKWMKQQQNRLLLERTSVYRRMINDHTSHSYLMGPLMDSQESNSNLIIEEEDEVIEEQVIIVSAVNDDDDESEMKYDEEKDNGKSFKHVSLYYYINKFLPNNYSSRQLMNDFHHILNEHSDEMERIYDKISTDISCDIKYCSSFIRHTRHKSKQYSQQIDDEKEENQRPLYYKYFYHISNEEEIDIMQICDVIHVCIMHSFDSGLCFTKDEWQSLENIVLKQQIKINEQSGGHLLTVDDAFLRMKNIVSIKQKSFHFRRRKSNTKSISTQAMNDIIAGYNSNTHMMAKNIKEEKSEVVETYFEHCKYFSNVPPVINDDEFSASDIILGKSSFSESATISSFNEFDLESKMNNALIKQSSKRVEKLLPYLVYGRRFYYWPYFKNDERIDHYFNIGYKNMDWFVVHFYSDLKTEIIDRTINNLDIHEWNLLLRKVELYITCDHFKNIDIRTYPSYIKQLLIEYNLDDADVKFTVQHLLSLMIFCNYPFLQKDFSQTFRKMNEIETDFLLKQRHSIFANFGRLLRESVECFVHRSHAHHNPISFYHGFEKPMHFTNSKIMICGPFSASVLMGVLITYATLNEYSQGIILKLTADQNINHSQKQLCFFNCSFLSDFSSEHELLFIGGYNQPLQISSIYDLPLNQKYKIHLIAISVMNNMIYGKPLSYSISMNITLHHFLSQMIENEFKLHNNSYPSQNSQNTDNKWLSYLPQYSRIVFHKFCLSVNVIRVNLALLNVQSYVANGVKIYGYPCLRSLFIDANAQHLQNVSVQLLLILFPNCKRIEIIGDIIDAQYHCRFVVNNIFFEKLLECFSVLSKMDFAICGISILNANERNISFEDVVEQWKNKYGKYGWSMDVNVVFDEEKKGDVRVLEIKKLGSE